MWSLRGGGREVDPVEVRGESRSPSLHVACASGVEVEARLVPSDPLFDERRNVMNPRFTVRAQRDGVEQWPQVGKEVKRGGRVLGRLVRRSARGRGGGAG